MIHVELHNILSEADFIKNAANALENVDRTKEVMVITIGNRPAVALIDLGQLEALTGKTVTPVAPVRSEVASASVMETAPAMPVAAAVEPEMMAQPMTEPMPPMPMPLQPMPMDPAEPLVSEPLASPPMEPLPEVSTMTTALPELPAMPSFPSAPAMPVAPVAPATPMVPPAPAVPITNAPEAVAPQAAAQPVAPQTFSPNPFLSRVQQNNFEEPSADLNSSSPLA